MVVVEMKTLTLAKKIKKIILTKKAKRMTLMIRTTLKKMMQIKMIHVKINQIKMI